MRSLSYVAIDFETSDTARDSACSVGLIRVENSRIVAKESFLIRPPNPVVRFTEIHGITWAMVRDQPTFAELWPRTRAIMADVDFYAAHWSSFDKGVMSTCCARAGLTMPDAPWVCTVKLARETWKLERARLPNVCAHLGIALKHHDAASDAEACARIILAAKADLPGKSQVMAPVWAGLAKRGLLT